MQDQFDIILGIAEGVGPVHNTGDPGHIITTEQLQGLVQRMRACIEEIAAVISLQALLVPASGEAIESDADLDNAAKVTTTDDLAHFHKIRSKTRLLEHSQNTA